MILLGRTIRNTKTVREAKVEKDSGRGAFRDILEESLVELCRKLDIQVPIWMKKNTTEFVRFRKTVFTSDQFIERKGFDSLEIKLE